jgi:hypothetical protein
LAAVSRPAIPPKSSSDFAVAASPVDAPELADALPLELPVPALELLVAALELVAAGVLEVGVVLGVEPHPATTTAIAASDASAPRRTTERRIRELRTETSW